MTPGFLHVKIDKYAICTLIQDYDKMLIGQTKSVGK